ncbi:MAG: MFS transporter [Planctomycetia bacterium]|nr:MFS transporter [Planctomycetia bacterium]
MSANPYVSPPPDAAALAGAGRRSGAWKWWVCGLLFLASTVNYVDRQTLVNVSSRIKKEFKLNDEGYGRLESAFGWAFAAGTMIFGFIADRTSIRWLYPTVLLLWSAMGFCTGLVETYAGLLTCRLFLGLFEAGHWPCALKTTQRLLTPADRTLGNSVLQGGASIGAIATPIIIGVMLTPKVGSWRMPFLVVGAIGSLWAVAWLVSIRRGELGRTAQAGESGTDALAAAGQTAADARSFFEVIFTRRFLILAVVVICINASWHMYRAWMQQFLEKGRGYSESHALYIISLYFTATEAGCLLAGGATLWLKRRGRTIHGARLMVFFGGAMLALLGVLLPLFPKGWALIALLMTIGAGLLALFPCFYSFTQELTVRHQGKVAGLLGTIAWASAAPLHTLYGRTVDHLRAIDPMLNVYDPGLQAVAVLPLLAAGVIWLCWERGRRAEAPGAS